MESFARPFSTTQRWWKTSPALTTTTQAPLRDREQRAQWRAVFGLVMRASSEGSAGSGGFNNDDPSSVPERLQHMDDAGMQMQILSTRR